METLHTEPKKNQWSEEERKRQSLKFKLKKGDKGEVKDRGTKVLKRQHKDDDKGLRLNQSLKED